MTMDGTFGQTTSQLGALRSILDSYPFSVGSLRELLQNADDAGASKQIFVNDQRTHPTSALYHPNLVRTQGPALLAFNDAHFVETDWAALQHAYESSKSDDSSKIGKYGVGFRSVFHMTDCPQILSEDSLAMFDPLQIFTGSSGFKKDLKTISSQYPDQLSPFQWFQNFLRDDRFDGTVIRCPLRTTASKIRLQPVSPQDISNLFRDFIREELGISLLFLRNIKNLELHNVDEHGVSVCLATLSISRSQPVSDALGSNSHITTVTTTIGSTVSEKRWMILDCPFDKSRAIQLLAEGLPGDPTSILKDHKLLPNVGIASPLDPTAMDRTSGRLFTYLPLPLPTGFPVHVHALFALTQSRQHLRNPKEVGVVSGSDDQILIRWNRLLHEHFIPRAWNRLLELLAQGDEVTDIFSVWPPEQRSPATSGESVFWEFLPKNLFQFITSSESAVWPVYHARPSACDYRPLQELITAEPAVPKDVLGALSAMGLQFTCPPAYVCRLIKDAADERFAVLSPQIAHAALRARLDTVRGASKDDVSVVLRYLLSTQDVRNVVGLPIFSTVSGAPVSLVMKEDALGTHVLMTRVEYDVFGSCDDTAIALHYLPFQASETMRFHGPQLLNVESLSTPRIIEYLTLYPNRMGLDLYLTKTDAHVIKWLSVFWTWMKDHVNREELLGKVKDLYLLPSSRGLRKANAALFRSRGEHPNSVAALSALGLPFLDADLSAAAQEVLAAFGLLRSISNVHEVLNLLPLPSSSDVADSTPLSRDVCINSLKHISTHAFRSCILQGAFTKEQIQKLKSLPIFPMATFPPAEKPAVVVQYRHIVDGVSLKSVASPPFLPSLDGVDFIQISSIAPAILEYVDPSAGPHLSDFDILDLTVRNFTTQADYVHAATLRYIVQNRYKVPPYVLELVQDAEFVTAKDGRKRRPGDLVDPASKLASLHDESTERQPRVASHAEKDILQSLQALRFMQHALSASIAQELIEEIAADPSSQKLINRARSLWSLITIERLDCSTLRIAPDQRCLPTDRGLRGPAECRDPTTTPPHLFNRVLAVLEPFSIPTSLVDVLRWNEPVSTGVLIKQLDALLDVSDNVFTEVLDIIKHLSSRDKLGDDDMESLRRVTADRKWVPTTDHRLAETRNAVFLAPIMDSGFEQVMSLDSRMKEFLRLLGCGDRPSYEAILLKLKEVQNKPASLHTVDAAIALLRSLPPDLDVSQRDQLLVPDETGSLRPFYAVHFNDIGEHARLVPMQNSYLTHALLEDALARKLGVARLGLDHDDVVDPGVDMGENPVTTVRKTISEYNEKQFTTEFLANAADAGATEFALMVNKFHPSSKDVLHAMSPAMASFCTSDSLVVYNNSIFSDEDFLGILRTSIGGKREKPGTIGQFGLGALTMFHFTEMAILVSNNTVLFLNPSKAHLPISGYASLRRPLNRVRQYWPSHLAAIDGLFGFDVSSQEPYHGTIFILPLRKYADHEGLADVISHREWTAEEVESEIIQHFRGSASNCLLFTPLTRISGHCRDAQGNENIAWSFQANQSLVQTESDTGYSVVDVAIVGDMDTTNVWRTARATVPEECIPEDILAPLRAHHRPRLPPVIGLAAMLGDSTARPDALFFSILPLAISTSLPVHVMASFLLSSDRRHIRLDQKSTPESDFNSWLLSHAIPPLYLFLLQNLLQVGDNKHWWPGQYHKSQDSYSHLLVHAFYSKYLMECTRPVFRNMFNPSISLTSQNVVLSREEPTSVHSLLSLLQPQRIARPASGPYHHAKEVSKIAVVSPDFVKMEILHGDASVITEFDSDTVEEVIAYLLGPKKDAANLVGLPILPLEDGSFGVLQSGSDSDPYFAWMPQKRNLHHHFPLECFVHPKLKLRDLGNLGLNVIPLHPQAILQFIEAKLPYNSPYEAPQDVADWIYDFWLSWGEYEHLGLTDNDILQFPLVPTVCTNIFVSLASCVDGSSVAVDGASQQTEAVCAFLNDLGVRVVRLHEVHLPTALVHILHKNDYSQFGFTTVLKALLPLQDSIMEVIAGTDLGLKTAFAEWARTSIDGDIPDELRPVAQKLPLWPSASSSSPPDIRPASDVCMLPRDVPLDIVSPFLDVCAADYGGLRFLRGPCLTLAQIVEHLARLSNTGTILDASDLDSYSQLLQTLMPLLPSTYSEPIPVPDCASTVRSCSNLYARDTLFLAAFDEESPFFIHPDFQALEHRLSKHGLRTESDLDMTMFMDCVQALNERSGDGDDFVARASVLFQAYGTSLPLRVSDDEQHYWDALDDCTFIPRSMATRRLLEGQDPSLLGLELPPNVIGLDAVVTPLDLVRKEYEAVAWTQRAMFATQPNQRVLVAHPNLGRPNLSEVVAHLRILSSLVDLSSAQRQIVLHDLKETYNFLNENASEPSSTQVISQLENLEVFLNVDDPETEEWRWDCANDLIFDSQDLDDIRHVRSFLMPYGRLLQTAGVLPVSRAQYLSNSWTSVAPPESKLSSIRTGFQDLRTRKILTDVVFVPSDISASSEPLLAHRSFLAVSSEYFADLFGGNFTEGRAASVADPISVPIPDYSTSCVRLVLDHIYTGTEPDAESTPLDLLLEALKLSGFWDVKDLFKLLEKEIANNDIITPRTLNQIQVAAEEAHAEELVDICVEYEQKNAELIRRYASRHTVLDLDANS